MEIDLGEGHTVRLIYDTGSSTEPSALIESHSSSVDGTPCGGIIPFAEGEWALMILNPLSVLPSINCDRCNSHGIISEGKWIDSRTPQDYEQWGD